LKYLRCYYKTVGSYWPYYYSRRTSAEGIRREIGGWGRFFFI
jgi:hypothetical protein